MEKENIFFFVEEKEKEDNIWRRKMHFWRERRMDIGEGKGGNYLGKENVTIPGPTNERTRVLEKITDNII